VPGKQLIPNAERDLAAAHLELMSRNISMIQSVSGVTDELLGRATNATSGRAIEARQLQGSLTTAKLFDNLRFAVQVQGEKQLSLIEQYFTEEKQFRITNDRGAPEYIAINTGLPEDDITRTKADFVISEGEWRATMRQAQAEQLLEILTRMPPQIAITLLDLVVEMMDVPNRDELVSRIRKINGQRDPDAEEPTPEELEAMQAQQQQAQMQQAMFEAELRAKLAKAGVDEARAAQLAAQVAKENIAAQSQAIEAAIRALMAPPAVPVADGLLHEAGFVGRTEQEHQAAIQAQQQALAEREQQQMQEQAALEQQQQDGMVPDGAMPNDLPAGIPPV